MTTARALEERFAAILHGPEGEDPVLHQVFADLAEAMRPDLRRLAEFLATPPAGEPFPTIGRHEARRLVRNAIASGAWVRRDETIAAVEGALRAFSEYIRSGAREMQTRRARGALLDDAAAEAFMGHIIEESLALLWSGFGMSMPSEGH